MYRIQNNLTDLKMNCPSCEAPVNPDAYVCEHCGALYKSAVPASSQSKSLAAAYTSYAASPDLAVVSDIGRRHRTNQDAGTVGYGLDGAVILMVADGVSSSDNAEIASSIGVQAAHMTLSTANAAESAKATMHRAISDADSSVLSVPYINTLMAEPQTTIIAALVRDRKATIGWVGDSRAYVISNLDGQLLTRDDSWFSDMVDSGMMTREQALADERSHVITQCLGMHDQEMEIHLTEIELAPGQLLLLASDGLWSYFEEPRALALAINTAPPGMDMLGICKHLAQLANTAGGYDNITIALFRYGSN